jgi:cytoskeleton protein RodZ
VGTVAEEKVRPLGEWLRLRREDLGISLEQAEEQTRIRVRYLQALEAEDLEALPDPVVGRGFLRNYAAYLGLDPKQAIERYAHSGAPAQPEPLPVRRAEPFTGEFEPVPLHEMPGWLSRRRWSLVVLAGLVLVALIAVGIWWTYPNLIALLPRRQLDPTRTAVPTFTHQPAIANLSTATHTPTATRVETVAPTAVSEAQPPPTLELTLTPTFTPLPSPTPSPPIYTGIFLELVFTDTSWIQVTTDGVRQFQGELGNGTYRSWYAEQRLELRIGNAGAVSLTVNGQPLGHLGAPGDVVDRVFEMVGEGVAEATFTPEITGTLALEPTSPPKPTSTTAPPTTNPLATEPVTPTIPITVTTPITATTSP